MDYLIHDVFQGIGAIDGETNKEKVSFRIRKWSKSIVFLLPCGIPKCQLNRLAGGSVQCVGDVVFEYGRDIFLFGVNSVSWIIEDTCYLWKVALTIADQ